MEKLKRIVVGIDVFSESNNVLKRAFMLAKENKAKLFVIYAVPTPWFSLPSYFSDKEISIDIKEITRKIEKKISSINDKKVSYSILVKEGDADDILLHESKRIRADMLILGANTKRKKKFLGSTAQKVAQKSHLPVLIVKNRAKSSYKNIVAPTDFQMQSKQSILFAKHIFPTTSITIVHAFDTIYSVNGPYTALGQGLAQYYTLGKSYAKKEMKSFIKDVFVEKGKVIDGELNSKDILVKYINKNSYDLVVLGSRSTAGFNALLGSIANHIMRETRSDVLVYVP